MKIPPNWDSNASFTVSIEDAGHRSLIYIFSSFFLSLSLAELTNMIPPGDEPVLPKKHPAFQSECTTSFRPEWKKVMGLGRRRASLQVSLEVHRQPTKAS
jgi:hypothetical protein